MKAFFTALQFLTRLPVINYKTIEPEIMGKSVAYYPVVGLVIGILLAVVDYLFAFLPVTVLAALILLVSVLINGALHLDGLADSSDAWLAGGDKKRSLEIMKDPYVGSAGVVSIVIILLFKYVLLLEIVGQGLWFLIVLIPIIARITPMAIMLILPYARQGGIAQNMVKFLPKNVTFFLIILIGLFFTWFNYFALLVMIVGIYFLGKLMKSRLGGFTGDTLGASIEVSEVLFLLGYVASLNLFS